MCIFYKDRKEKTLRYLLSIVLQANTHVIMWGMVGIVLLEYIWEIYKDKEKSAKVRKKQIYCLIITIILLIITILPLIGSLSTNRDLEAATDEIVLKVVIALCYYPVLLIMQMFTVFLSNVNIISVVFINIFLILLFYEIKNYPFTYLKIFFAVIWQCLIYSFIYSAISFQKASTIIFIVLYFKWINAFKENKKIKDGERKILNLLWLVLVVINIIDGILYVTVC